MRFKNKNSKNAGQFTVKKPNTRNIGTTGIKGANHNRSIQTKTMSSVTGA